MRHSPPNASTCHFEMLGSAPKEGHLERGERSYTCHTVWEVSSMAFFVYWAAAFAAQPGGLRSVTRLKNMIQMRRPTKARQRQGSIMLRVPMRGTMLMLCSELVEMQQQSSRPAPALAQRECTSAQQQVAVGEAQRHHWAGLGAVRLDGAVQRGCRGGRGADTGWVPAAPPNRHNPCNSRRARPCTSP